MPFLDEAQAATRSRGGRFIDEEPAIPSSGLGPPPQTTDLLDRLADAASRGYRFYQQSELIREGVTPDSAKEISRLQQEIEQIPRGPGIERFQQAKGWRESFQAIADDPINTMGELMAESLGSLIPKAIKTIPAATALGAGAGLTLGGPAGLATGARGGFIAGTGITSGSLEYAGKVLEALQEAGVDTKDPEQLHNAFTNPSIIDDIKQRAVRKAVPIAAFDALSAGLAGRFLARPAASILGRVGQAGAELGQQVALAGGGEVAGELASGERLNPPSILAEMLLEPIAGAPEIATGVATRPRATRRIGETPARPFIEPSTRVVLPGEQNISPEGYRVLGGGRFESDVAPPPEAYNVMSIRQGGKTRYQFRLPPKETYATTQGEVQESVQPQRIETPPRGIPTEAGPGDIVQPTTTVQAQEETPDVLAPVFPLRPGTKGTPWEDQRGRPVRQNPDTKRYEVVPEEAAPEQKIAPVQFLQVQEGMPELVWYKLTGDITSPEGRVYPAGKNISNGELIRFGYTIPESELAKSAPAPVAPPTDIQVIGQVTPEQQPLLDEVLARIREENAKTPGLPVRRVELIKAAPGFGIVSTHPSLGIFDTVDVDLDRLASSGVDIGQYLSLAINEEIIHNAGGRALQEEWSRSDQSIPFNDYWLTRMDAIAGEMTPAQHSRVREVYGRDLNDRVAAAEFVRMLVQERMRGQITEETLGRNTIQYLKQILRRLLDALRTATGTSRQNLQQHVNAIEDILRGQQQIRTVEEQQQVGLTDEDIIRLGAAQPEEQPDLPFTRFFTKPEATRTREQALEAQAAAEAFEKMRRESGAQPPLELTPEQQRAREINERIRGRRPETLSAASPFREDDEGKPTEVFGVKDYVTERPVLTHEQLTAGRAHAKTIFDQAGLTVVDDPEMDGWRLVYDGQKKNNEGRKLIDLLTRELATQHQAGKPELAPFLNNVRLNFRYGTMDQLFDLPIRLKLFALSQGDISRRGRSLRAVAGLPEDITFVAQNIDVELIQTYSDMFGGEEIQKFLDKTKEATVKKMDKPTQDGVLAGKPEMQQEVDKANAARDPSAKIPSAQQLANEVFNQQFDSFDDLVNALKDRLMKEFKLSDADATKIARKFKDTFEKPFKDAAQKSYEEVRKALGQIIGSRKGIWEKIQKAINKGVFDNIQVLREVAKAMGMRPPTEEEIKKMKGLAAREREMGSLTPKELEEHKKMGTTPAKLKEAMDARLASTNIARSQIRKQMEVLWTRFTKPIPGLSIDSWRGFKNTRRNLAAAINEFISANLLFKLGFPSRLGISVFSQWLVNTPTRAIANALVRYHDALAKGQQTSLYKDMAMHLGDSYRAQYNAIVPALESARAALLGRGEARNIDRLMSGIAAMDRIAAKAKEYWDAGDYGRGSLLWMLAQIRMGYRVAQSLDNLQGVPAEYSEMRARVINELLGQGMSRAEALNRADFVIGDMKQQHMEAVADTKKAWEATGITGSANELSESAWDLVKQKQYQRIKELGLPADEFRDQIKFYRNVLAWNEAEHKGIGGGIARLLQRVEEVAEKKGIPTAITRFSNAIGITINRALAFTPFYKQADYGGYGTSGWFKTETDKQQRRVEAFLGSTVGTAAFMLALSGMWLVRRKWPKDKEEQDLWQQEGHRPGTVEIPVGDGGSFIPMSLNNSPLMFVAPYLAAGGALHDLLVEREGQQKKLNEEAAKTGAVPGKIRPMSFGDMALVALEGAKQAVIGGRTPAATLASVTYYGLPNAKKMAASYVSPMVPGLPALQEVSRMAGISLDDRFASVWDFMLPLPGSEARRLNMLGDPVKTPNDIQRITQIMTGGNYPLPVDAAEAKARPAYDALFNSGYRPPSINPAKGYQIGNQYRPMNNSELDKYIELRGKYLKEGLIGTGPYIDKAAAQRVYEDANQRALSEVGVQQPVRTSSTPRTTTTRRTTIRGPRRLRTRAGSRLRRPRIRRLSYRRPRLAVRRPRLRRIRRLAA